MRKKRLIRILKWFFGIIGGFFLLVTLLLYIFKDDICNLIISEANKQLKAEVKVSEVDLVFWGTFPNLSVDFNNVFIQDTYEGSSELDTLLYTDKLRLKFNPMDIWRENYTLKSIEVSKGTIQLKVNEEGLNNYDILKDTTEGKSSEFDMNLESVNFRDFRFSYINQATDQIYETELHDMNLQGALSARKFTTAAQTNLRIISARSGQVNLVKNQEARLNIALNMNLDSGTVHIPKSTIFVAELPFSFNGDIDTVGYNFKLQGENIQIRDAANNLALEQTEDVKRFDGTGTLLFDLSFKGTNSATEPAEVECKFGIEKGTLTEPSSKIALKELQLDGFYTNKGGEKKEMLRLDNISFRTVGGPFKGQLKMTNFDAPLITGKTSGWLNLAIIDKLFRIRSIKELSGTSEVFADFRIKANPTEREDFNIEIQKCKGNVVAHNVNVQFTDDKRVFRKINGKIYLRDDQVGIEDITCTLGKSDFRVNGLFKDIVKYFNNQGSLNAKIDISSDFIAVSDLGSTDKEEKFDDPREYMLPREITGDVYLDVRKLSYEGHSFFDLKGNMSVGDRKLNFSKIALKNAGAEIRGSLSIEEKTPEIFHLKTNVASKDIDFRKLFVEWHNFDQKVITDKNISGEAKANVIFEAPFDLRSGIISSGIIAQVGLQIDNGRLRNVAAFKEITKSLRGSSLKRILGKENIDEFEKKLLDLKFESLKNNLIIRDGMIIIPEMSVHSSALDMEVSGKHTFENKIDYRFGFRFRDLKQTRDSEFGEIMDDGTGFRVYMKMYGDLDNPIIEWDDQARKEQAKANREEAKQDAKAILKSEFGLFKNDTTVKSYIPDKRPKEELIINFDPVNSIDTIIEEREPKRDSKFNKFIKKMKEESIKEKEIEFDIDD